MENHALGVELGTSHLGVANCSLSCMDLQGLEMCGPRWFAADHGCYFVADSRIAAEWLREVVRIASWACAWVASGVSMASLTPGMTTAA